MSNVVIIGSGMAGIGLAELLAQDSKFFVTVLSDVANLQKKFSFIAGKTVAQILPEAKQIVFQTGVSIGYDLLVLATGSEAFVPPPWLPYQK